LGDVGFNRHTGNGDKGRGGGVKGVK